MKSQQLMIVGIEQVIGNQSEDWKTNYENLVLPFLESHNFFTGETVTGWMEKRIGLPKHPNAWGAMFNAHFTKSHSVQWTGRLVSSIAPLSHATPIREYRSTCFCKLEAA